MAKEYIKAIASAVLPTQILDYFLVVGVEQTATEIYSSLDELPDKELTDDIHFKSKGFMEPVHVTEFPIRNQLDTFTKSISMSPSESCQPTKWPHSLLLHAAARTTLCTTKNK